MDANPGYYQVRLIALADFGLEQVRIDRDGTKLVRVVGDDLQEKGHYPYVFKAASGGGRNLSLAHRDQPRARRAFLGLERPTVQLATPVVGNSGEVLGVVVINVDLNGTFAQLAADMPKDVQLFLANGDGDFLVNPDPAPTFRLRPSTAHSESEQFPETRELVARHTDQALFEARDGAYASHPVVAAFISRQVAASSMEKQLVLGLTQPLATVLEHVNSWPA